MRIIGYQEQTPPTPPQQPPGGYPPPQQPQNDPNKNKAIAAMVLGIIAIVIAWFGWSAILAIVLSIIALVLSVPLRKAIPKGAPNYGMANAGFILSIIALVLSLIGFVTCFVCAGFVGALSYY